MGIISATVIVVSIRCVEMSLYVRVYIVKSSCESHMDRGLFYRVYFGYRAVSTVDFIKSTYGEGCYSCWFSV